MEPRPTTPADAFERDPFEARGRPPAPDDSPYPGSGPDSRTDDDRGRAEESPPREDWSARYGAPPPRPGPDFSALFVVLDGLRRSAPAELQEGLKSFIREGLLALRALIDWYLERLDRTTRRPEVEDIPIDP